MRIVNQKIKNQNVVENNRQGERLKTGRLPWTSVHFSLIFLFLFSTNVFALQASWYSEASLKNEGTWKTSKGVIANGQQFNERALTCATRLFNLGTRLKITNLKNGNSVEVVVSDRIGKRFAKTRIDLSKKAFEQIADLKEGLINISVQPLTRSEQNG